MDSKFKVLVEILQDEKLFRLFMQGVLFAVFAILLHLQPLFKQFFVLAGEIVGAPAILAFKFDHVFPFF